MKNMGILLKLREKDEIFMENLIWGGDPEIMEKKTRGRNEST